MCSRSGPLAVSRSREEGACDTAENPDFKFEIRVSIGGFLRGRGAPKGKESRAGGGRPRLRPGFSSTSAYGTGPITRAILGEQQRIADTFLELKLIPKRIDVLEAAAPGIA